MSTKKLIEKYMDGIIEDERGYAAFLTQSCFALIGANWVLLQSSTQQITPTVAGSLLACVLYLVVRGLRHRLNIAHLREIIDNAAERMSPARIKHSNSLQTAFGKMSGTLNHFELPLLVSSAALFVISAVLTLTKTLL